MSPEDRQQWHDDEDALRLAAHTSALEATETGERAERALWRDRGKIIASLIRERDEARAEVRVLRESLYAADEGRRTGPREAATLRRAEAAEAREAALRGRLDWLADDMDKRGEPGPSDSEIDRASRCQIREDVKRLRAVLASVPAPTDEAGACECDEADERHGYCLRCGKAFR